jgi:hypothetical protein
LKGILPGEFFNFGPTNEVVFKSKDSVWKFRFGYKQSGSRTYIDYRTINPLLKGTIFLKKEAGPELEVLIESFAIEEPENNRE